MANSPKKKEAEKVKEKAKEPDSGWTNTEWDIAAATLPKCEKCKMDFGKEEDLKSHTCSGGDGVFTIGVGGVGDGGGIAGAIGKTPAASGFFNKKPPAKRKNRNG